MRNRMYGGVRGRKTRVGEKLHRFPPTRLSYILVGYSLSEDDSKNSGNIILCSLKFWFPNGKGPYRWIWAMGDRLLAIGYGLWVIG